MGRRRAGPGHRPFQAVAPLSCGSSHLRRLSGLLPSPRPALSATARRLRARGAGPGPGSRLRGSCRPRSDRRRPTSRRRSGSGPRRLSHSSRADGTRVLRSRNRARLQRRAASDRNGVLGRDIPTLASTDLRVASPSSMCPLIKSCMAARRCSSSASATVAFATAWR